MKQITNQENNVRNAFSKQAKVFDEENEGNTLVVWVRSKVRKEVAYYLKPTDSILELNCGTGIDSIYFAQGGHQVLATDISDAMLNQLQKKTLSLGLSDNITTLQCSFTDLNKINAKKFDYIFSNFGGLNCTDTLNTVLASIASLLNNGGYCSLVIMPKICPWELVTAIKGNFKLAFRRLKKNGSLAHIEGEYFKCYYYNPSYIISNLPGFRVCSIKGLCITVPPPHNEPFAIKHPKLFNALEKIENTISRRYPFNRWCDHYIITLKKED